MKKFIFGFAMLCALTITSCGNGNKKATEAEVTETTVVEEVATEVAATDSVAVEEVATEAKVEE